MIVLGPNGNESKREHEHERDDSGGEDLSAYFDNEALTAAERSLELPVPAPGTSDENEALPEKPSLTDAFRAREEKLYSRALDIYCDILESGPPKLQKDAAKEVVAVYHKRLDLEQKERTPQGDRIIAIGNDALREALSRAARGIEPELEHKIAQGNHHESEDVEPLESSPGEGPSRGNIG